MRHEGKKKNEKQKTNRFQSMKMHKNSPNLKSDQSKVRSNGSPEGGRGS